MPLRIKRGTNNQRLQYIPAEGELIYTTDEKQMWVGDGVTQGGIAVGSGGGVAGGSLTSNINLNERSIEGTGTININGDINCSTIFANLSGNVTSNIVTSGSIRITSNTLSTVDDSPILINQKVFFQDDVRLSFDLISNDGTIVFKNFDKILSNGTLRFDGNKIISDNIFSIPETDSIIGVLELGSLDNPLQIKTYWKDPIEPLTKTYGLINNTNGITYNYFGFRNTVSNPTQVMSGDYITRNQYHGWAGEGYLRSSAIEHRVDPFTDPVPGNVSGIITLTTEGNSGSNVFSMDSRGYVGINQFPNRAEETLDVNGNTIIRGTVKAVSFEGSLIGQDSSLIVDSITGNINGNNITGTSFRGSIIDNNSNIVIDAITGNINGNVINGAAFKGTLVGDDSSIIVDGITHDINANNLRAFALTSNYAAVEQMTVSIAIRTEGLLTFANLDTPARDSLLPNNGSVIYNITTESLQLYKNGEWTEVSSGAPSGGPETDPTVPFHVKSITTTNILDWDAAYSWGDHSLAGYLTNIPAILKRDLVGSVFADDSSLIINGMNGNINGNIITASSFKGNFADNNSNLIIDGATKNITGSVITGTTVIGGSIRLTNNVIDTTDSSSIIVEQATAFRSDVTADGNITARTITASEFISTSVGSPELTSATDLKLSAGTAVIVTQSPFRLANLTTAQRDGIIAVNGDMIYNSDVNKLQGYQNGSWINLDGTL